MILYVTWFRQGSQNIPGGTTSKVMSNNQSCFLNANLIAEFNQ